jgi:hypothetical protein
VCYYAPALSTGRMKNMIFAAGDLWLSDAAVSQAWEKKL